MQELMKKFRLVKDINSLEFSSPEGLYITDSGGNKEYYYFSKNARNKFHNLVYGMKPQTSIDLYNSSEGLWYRVAKELSTINDNDSKYNPYKLNYIIYSDEDYNRIVGFYNESDKEEDIFTKVQELLKVCNNYPHRVSYDDDLIKIILDIEGSEDYNIIALIEMNFKGSSFKLSFGTSEESRIALMPPTLLYNDFVKFVSSDIDYEISLSRKVINTDRTALYDKSFASNMYLSMREVLDILKAANIKIVTNKDGTVSNETIPTDIAEYFNATGLTYKGIKKMPYLSKSIRFKYSITVDYMLSYISDRYYNDEKLTSGVLDMIMNIYNKMSDFGIVKRSEVIKFAKEE